MKLYYKIATQLLPLSLFVCSVSTHTAQDIQWEKSYGGQQADYLADVVPTPDYGFLVGGSSLSRRSGNKSDNGNGDLDYWIWKMNENGDPEWQKSYGGAGADFLQTIKLTADGGFILAGTSDSAVNPDAEVQKGFGGNDFWIIKLDAKGNQEWEQRFGGVGQDDLVTLSLTTDGGYIIGGSSDSPAADNGTNPNSKQHEQRGNMDYWVLKLDRKGKIQWQKTFGGDYADLLRTVTPTTDGGFLVGGYSNSPQSGDKTNDNYGQGGDFWILKLDSSGTIQWQQTIGGDHDDQLNAVAQTPDRGFLLGGNSNSNASGSKSQNADNGTDFWIYKTDEKGNPLWQKTYNYGVVDILTSMVVNNDQTILIGGYSPAPTTQTEGKSKPTTGTDDYIALKISDKGDVLWERTVGSKGSDMLRKVIETRDGGYIMAGTAMPTSNNDSSSSVVKTAANRMTMGIQQTENKQVAKYRDQANAAVAEQVQGVNNSIKKGLDTATQKTKDVLGLKDDLPIKLTPNANALQLGDLLGNDDNKNNGNNAPTSKPLPRSGDKSTGFGNNDFWVVKLRDRNKPTKEKALIEAVPIPATTFTNVIVGYEYTKGTATVVDLAGHTLQQFAVSSRTIPIDLSNLPEGIYIVNVATNVGNESVKVIKGIKN